jgi:hypothetical protein
LTRSLLLCNVAGTFPVGSVPQDIPARAGRHRPPLGSSPSSEGPLMGRGVRYQAFEAEASRGSLGPEVRAPCLAVGWAFRRSSVLLRIIYLPQRKEGYTFRICCLACWNCPLTCCLAPPHNLHTWTEDKLWGSWTVSWQIRRQCRSPPSRKLLWKSGCIP